MNEGKARRSLPGGGFRISWLAYALAAVWIAPAGAVGPGENNVGKSEVAENMSNGTGTTETRPRAREAGLRIGVLETGPLNAITDVPGVLVGQVTVVEGERVRTGVTAVLPHSGNLFREKTPAGIHVGNGFGKFIGATQIQELGELETPILMTSTLNAFRAADALVDYTLSQPGNEDVRSLNPVVGETNDGELNDIRGRHVTKEHCLQAIRDAATGPVEEGVVGAGTGTVAFGLKAGMGTSSRRLPADKGGYLVGVLVQANYGGELTIDGVPVGRELKRAGRDGAAGNTEQVQPSAGDRPVDPDRVDGSIIVIIATDAPVDSRNLERMSARAMLGLGRTGSAGSNGSGDYALAFSTDPRLRIKAGYAPVDRPLLPNDAMSPLFAAVVEATEEAVLNSLFKATTVTGCGKTAEALPLELTLKLLRERGAL